MRFAIRSSQNSFPRPSLIALRPSVTASRLRGGLASPALQAAILGIYAAFGGIAPAHAAATGAPWEAPLTTFLNSLTGPVAQIVGVAAVVIAGFGIAFSEGGSGLRKLVWVAMGLSIAFAASTFFLPLFGFGGGVAF